MHAYEKAEDGLVEPRHFVNMTSRPDELRPTRITDLRKWWKDGRLVCPSVTEALNILNKYGLNVWKIDQHLFQAHQLDPSQFASREEYLAEVKRLTELELDKAPTAGTDLHDKLEQFVKGTLPKDDEDYGRCLNVQSYVYEYTGIKPSGWEAEVKFVSRMGYGGCADLVATNGSWVIDYKTKQLAKKFKVGKMAFDEHRSQLAAYREGLGMPKARCANVFVCLETGEVDFHEHTEHELQHGWEIFQHALAIWKLKNNFPTEMLEAA